MPDDSLFLRIRQERERLGFNQTDFAALAGASKRSQIGWEQGRTNPDAEALAAWAMEGADVQYILTGVRSSAALTDEEQQLISLYRAAPLAVRAAAVAALSAGSAPQQTIHGGVGQQFNAQVGQVASGNIINKGRRK